MYGPHWYCAPLLGSTRGCCWYHASAAAAAAANPGGFGVRVPAAPGLAFDPTDSYAPAENAEYGGGPLDDHYWCDLDETQKALLIEAGFRVAGREETRGTRGREELGALQMRLCLPCGSVRFNLLPQ